MTKSIRFLSMNLMLCMVSVKSTLVVAADDSYTHAAAAAVGSAGAMTRAAEDPRPSVADAADAAGGAVRLGGPAVRPDVDVASGIDHMIGTLTTQIAAVSLDMKGLIHPLSRESKVYAFLLKRRDEPGLTTSNPVIRAFLGHYDPLVERLNTLSVQREVLMQAQEALRGGLGVARVWPMSYGKYRHLFNGWYEDTTDEFADAVLGPDVGIVQVVPAPAVAAAAGVPTTAPAAVVAEISYLAKTTIDGIEWTHVGGGNYTAEDFGTFSASDLGISAR